MFAIPLQSGARTFTGALSRNRWGSALCKTVHRPPGSGSGHVAFGRSAAIRAWG